MKNSLSLVTWTGEDPTHGKRRKEGETGREGRRAPYNLSSLCFIFLFIHSSEPLASYLLARMEGMNQRRTFLTPEETMPGDPGSTATDAVQPLSQESRVKDLSLAPHSLSIIICNEPKKRKQHPAADLMTINRMKRVQLLEPLNGSFQRFSNDCNFYLSHREASNGVILSCYTVYVGKGLWRLIIRYNNQDMTDCSLFNSSSKWIR